jgi:DHA3 family macrolide efflux protein-like MFS transporter
MDEITASRAKAGWALPFFAIWTGQAFSLLGSQLVQFALVWWLTQSTGSATVLASASMVGLLPQVLLGPLAGALVDRWNRRSTMILADGLIALVSLALALLFWAGRAQVWHIYGVLFIRSAAGAFHWPAMQASTSLMVPNQHLSRVQGVNQMLNGGLNILSAPVGALLLSVLPMYGILGIDLVTALLAILPLLFISVPQPPGRLSQQKAGAGKTSVTSDLVIGLRYVWTWPGLMLILFMATLINLLLNPGFALLPLLVTRHFGGGALQLAWLESTWGTGVIAGGLILSVWGGFRRKVFTSMMGLIGIGLSSLTIGLLPPQGFQAAIAAMLLSGLANSLTNGSLFAVIQAAVAPEVQGRVLMLIVSAASAATPLGLAIAGPLADALGIQTWFIVGGIFTTVMGLAGFLIPAITHLEQGHPSQAPAKAPLPALSGAADDGNDLIL